MQFPNMSELFDFLRLLPAQRKFDRCASAAALYDQRMKDFDAWCSRHRWREKQKANDLKPLN
jgi:hypothetical protein